MFGDASAGVTETGIIKMFKMAQGNTVHLHCVVKLCLGGSAADCDPVSIFSRYVRLAQVVWLYNGDMIQFLPGNLWFQQEKEVRIGNESPYPRR